jgi:hypothetical protein
MLRLRSSRAPRSAPSERLADFIFSGPRWGRGERPFWLGRSRRRLPPRPKTKGRHDGVGPNQSWPSGKVRDAIGADQPEPEPEPTADQRQRDGLDEELGENVAPPRTDRQADADLCGLGGTLTHTSGHEGAVG